MLFFKSTTIVLRKFDMREYRKVSSYLNNKLKVIKRVAFGFRDFDYFFLRIMDAFRGKPDFA